MTNFWGPEDISVHFCENKYDQVFWIAEFYNTISCVFYILVGLILWKFQNQKTVGILLCCVGVGSMTLHMTLRYYGQWLDELSMLAVSFHGIKKIKKSLSNYLLIPIFGLYYYFNEYFIYFFIFFTCSQLYLAYESVKLLGRKKHTLKKKISTILYIQFFLMGAVCWFFDQYYCEELRAYNFHAWWHFFTSLGALCGFIVFSD